MPFLAFLKLIPLKDWLKIGAVAAVLGWFTYFVVHERHVAVDEALAPIKVLAQKAQQQVAIGTAVAQTTEESNGKSYDAAVARPAQHPLGIVCVNPSRSAVPQADGVLTPGIGELPADLSAGQQFDPSGPVLDNDAHAEAQIIYLQGRIHELETQMEASP